MKKSYINYLLKKTEDNYNIISAHFSNKRTYLTPDILEFKKFVKQGDKILDLGCGNGRLFELFNDKKHIQYTGVDPSEKLVEIARKKYPTGNFEIGNGLDLKYAENSFDIIFSLAVMHHLPGKELRVQFLREAFKVLKHDGTMILTVWDLTIDPKVKAKLFINKIKHFFGISKLESGDLFYPYFIGEKNKKIDRYIHCFSLPEIKEISEKAGFSIIESGYNHRGKRVVNRNIFLVLKKP